MFVEPWGGVLGYLRVSPPSPKTILLMAEQERQIKEKLPLARINEWQMFWQTHARIIYIDEIASLVSVAWNSKHTQLNHQTNVAIFVGSW